MLYFQFAPLTQVAFASFRAKSEIVPGASQHPTTQMAMEPLPRPGARDRSVTNGPIALESPQPKPAVSLSAGDVEAIAEATARKLVELVADRGKTFGLVGPRELAEGLGVSLDYVYAHATELGAMRLGSGPKARIRFDLDGARRALEERAERPRRQRRRSR